MSSKAKNVGKAVKKRTQEQIMACMEEVFNLPLHQELRLRHIYRKHIRRARREQKKLYKLAGVKK